MEIDLSILTNQQTPIYFNNKQTITPTHLVFRELNLDAVGKNYEYSRRDLRYPLATLKIYDLHEILLNIDDYHNTTIHQEPVDEYKVLSIPLRVSAYMIFSISQDLGWFFDPKKLGVTLGNTTDGTVNKGLYENLWHYDEDRGVFSLLPIENCRTVAFSAMPLPPKPGEDNVQPINFNLIDTKLTPVTVDPDIRYPGNGGTFDGDQPPPFVDPSTEAPQQ